jgi:alanine racemase
MSIEARLAHIKTIPAGAGVGYNHIWVADVPTRVGLVPMGYADGLPRPASGVHVVINGTQRPIIGRIAMDQCVVDLGDVPASIGDHVQVLGHAAMDAQGLGLAAGTIGYEVVTRIGSRLPRHYVG